MDGMTARDDQLAGLAVLAEPLRRQIYLQVVGESEPVGRDAAAAAAGVPRSVAAFHLDKLAGAGLLDVEYRRPPGRGGPGAGRPAKLYRRGSRELALSIPERHYDLAASLFGRALLDAWDGGVTPQEALQAVARDYGRAVGAQLRGKGRRRQAEVLRQVASVLTDLGYEPRVEDGRITLGNCPFRSLALENTGLVCTMNLDVVKGIVEGLEGATAVPAPADAHACCCVAVVAG
jgi:predicted ArsR family transcriptional regulator